MKYTFEIWSLNTLLDLHEGGKLNLNPPYQRNDIWPLTQKKRLIESVVQNYPLPTFFLHKKPDLSFDMVDGQQRTRTFLGFRGGYFPYKDKIYFSEENHSELYKEYKISVAIIENEGPDDNIEDFYFRVNKFGIKLNRPEIKKAEYFDSKFQELVEKMADNEQFNRLNIFTDAVKNRLNDLDFVSELITYLKFGITDKKIAVDKLYEDRTITGEEFEELGTRFSLIIDKIAEINNFKEIRNTRFKQRNDFFTLFTFIDKNIIHLTDRLLKYQYSILVQLDPYISPSNEDCWPLQEYANNCVSQSNSKKARESRLKFFEDVLLNKVATPYSVDSIDPDSSLIDIMVYFNIKNSDLEKCDDYYLLPSEKLVR